MASNYPDEGRPASDGGGEHVKLPFRSGNAGRPAQTEARAELRDRETYYAELRHAVHRQSQSIAGSRAAHADRGDTWTRADDSTTDDNWAPDTMATRLNDTWT